MAGKIKLAKLLAVLPDHTHTGPLQPQAPVTNVVCDSRQVQPGSVFVAVKGVQADGHSFISQALANGALAVVAENPVEGAPCVIVPDSRAALGKLAQAFHGQPAKNLANVAVTGTNGKTTFCYLLRSILQAAGHPSAMFGTTGHCLPDEFVPAGTTTPSALELAELMARARAADVRFAVLEASSHALDQERLAGIDFDVAVFTNLSGDHLDYHGSMEHYLQAKAKLFEHLRPEATAVLNRADPASEGLARRTRARKIWYGLGTRAKVKASGLSSTAAGSSFILNCAGKKLPVNSHLPGTHNVVNCLAAAAAALALDITPQNIVAGLEQLKAVPGRLESVPWSGPFHVLVDYAHTHDALANVLRAVRAITARKLIVVFGCGGDRDTTKRPKMAAQASDLADTIFVTSDNPRTEDPEDIIRQIVTGITRQARPRTLIVPDRRQAIEQALASAKPGDVVLLAGKGHEDYQIIGTQRRPFDDKAVAADWLSTHAGKVTSEYTQ